MLGDGPSGDDSGNPDHEEDVAESVTSPRTRGTGDRQDPSPHLEEFPVHPLLT